MQNIVIIDADEQSLHALQVLQATSDYQIVGIVEQTQKASISQFATRYGIPHGPDPESILSGNVHIVLDFSEECSTRYIQFCPNATVVPKNICHLLVKILLKPSKETQFLQSNVRMYQSIFNSVDEGMIGIDEFGIITLFNDSASKMLDVTVKEVIGKPILSIIPSSGLLEVLHSGQPVSDDELQLSNGLEILSSRYPIINQDGKTTGAFAVFKDISGVIRTAEEITDLKRVKTMLEAIIHSSDDAISVVDSEGLGILVNPAYTRLTGLTEREVIGQPATVDISSGESIHMKVLETKRPVRGVNMQIGEKNRNVIVNVAPIIVDKEVKGSVGVIHDITEMRSLMKELDQAKAMIRDLESTYTFDDIIGSNEDLLIAVGQAKIAAGSEIPIMLRGEPGSGKELFAHAIHTGSRRSNGDFIRVSCATLDVDSIEMALIHTKIQDDKLSGTLFLDEITELNPEVQEKLLEYLRIGSITTSGQSKQLGVRIIASSAANLERAVHEGRLSEELFFQLTRISIRIPALRTRPEDILLITETLLAMLNQEFGMSIQRVTSKAMERLQSYEWPGNVRELENVISRAMILSESGSAVLNEEDIIRALSSRSDHHLDSNPALPDKRTLASLMEDHEKLLLEASLKENNGQKVIVADRLGISLRSLYYKLEKYKLI
ncbi:sigma 54-interacting transcriptional regulator [Sporosarcina aquimarina]|uniref:Sigma 54-interacting transcriptional regulator n=1 Tax=Sporosarcina aquimarina TaxID=114975 RepID=A0ABU4G2Y8_9BACL|nr:sigma 54-interacting transcriptional regulator [Sporosarcina aquimarina]MDW0111327.1 sigma 54-interacting transcriptional regulator [Sporosarcina aquimarina]